MIEGRAGLETSQRAVIVHYHFFKNAGTSVDRTLRENFPSGWAQKEADGGQTMSPWELRAFLAANTWVMAVSSHTAELPPPRFPDVAVIPVLFIRHPLDRIRSIYDFERRQGTDTPGALAAHQMDLARYIEWRLARAQTSRDLSVADFQTHRLAKGALRGSPLGRAMRTVDALPFVGLVESYELSMERLEAVICDYFPDVRLRTFQDNRTASVDGTLEERIARFRALIGEGLFERLVVATRDDLALWTAIRHRYAS